MAVTYHDLKEILFLDIETVSATPVLDQLDPRLQELWQKKATYLKREEEDTADSLFKDRAAIYAEFGKVVCIGVGFFYHDENQQLSFRTKSLYGHDEKKLLEDFIKILDHGNGQYYKLCAHNGKEFDFPYLCRRMLINKLQLPKLLQIAGKKPWEIPHLDTMEMWKFGDYKHFTSLDLLAAIFDIKSSKSDMDGSQVSKVYYEDNDLTKIAEYCSRDVVVLAQLFLNLLGSQSIPEENIFMV